MSTTHNYTIRCVIFTNDATYKKGRTRLSQQQKTPWLNNILYILMLTFFRPLSSPVIQCIFLSS